MDKPDHPPARGLTVWFTGLSSSGKTTLSRALHDELKTRGYPVEWLDGDAVRQKFSKDLGYSREDRNENIRRIGSVAEELTRQGTIVLVSAISPYREARDQVRRRIGHFLEIWVHAPLAVCESRDRNGIYARARANQLQHVTGIDDPYEAPLAPDVECCTDRETLAESVAKVLAAVEHNLAARLT